MEIERVNDNTIKFNLTYEDLETRGYSRYDIWYNREKSEELFWHMMDEINETTEFIVEGPLWIQVHAKKLGIEVLVTTTEENEETSLMEQPTEEQNFQTTDLASMSDRIARDLIEAVNQVGIEETSKQKIALKRVYGFNDIDPLIDLSKAIHKMTLPIETKLFGYEQQFYLYVTLIDENQVEALKNVESIILEYGERTVKPTTEVLEVYGTSIVNQDVFSTLVQQFA